jgi:enamine deaminase RidA (YjgF/YER057c/UK114 family)
MATMSRSPARSAENVLMSDDEEARRSQEHFGFADAVTAGDKIYLSGIVVVLDEGDSDIEGAFERVYQRVDSILKRAGVGWDDIVDITSFHTDVTTQIEPMVTVQKRYIKSPPPAWTAIGIDRLIRPNGITEIKFVAQRSDTSG